MIKTITYNIHEVAEYINWVYFFHAWGFAPKFAAVADIHGCDACRAGWLASFSEEDRPKAAEAMQLHKDAKRMLAMFDEDFHTYAHFGLFEANSKDDGIIFYDEKNTYIPLLRQQHTAKPDTPYLCISDFIRPAEHGIKDKVGVFCATVDPEMEHLYEEGESADDFKHLLCQTLADRLAEATTEKMHEDVRKKHWGYSPDENFSKKELFLEKYQGIRPAVGYPSLPDQSVNFILDSCIDFKTIGIRLTDNGAMIPHASVSGLMISHPQSRYFNIGKIGNDQLENYAQRRGISVEKAKKFLAANL